MISGNRVLGIIPARSGSTGLPGKSVREFCGKPLIAWSIYQGINSGCIDNLLVSTDSQEIANVALSFGANVPFLRPDVLADDSASSVDVILHAVDFLADLGDVYDYIVLLEQTSPLREESDIVGALESLIANQDPQSIVRVAKAESTHPAYLFTLENNILTPMLSDVPTNLRRQDLPSAYYFLEGCVYASSVKALRHNRSFYHGQSIPWIVERYKSIEIDEYSDFVSAEALLKARLDGVLR